MATVSTSEPSRVLVVNGDELVCTALSQSLTRAGYAVTAAANAHEALSALRERNGFRVMIQEARLPDSEGVDLVSQALVLNKQLAIVVLSSLDDTPQAALCMQLGALDCLVKPVQRHALNQAVQRALRRHELGATDDAAHRAWMQQVLAGVARAVEVEHERLEEISTAALQALVNALEAKNPYLGGHSLRVEALSVTIAAELQLTEDEVEAVRTAGRLHDIGMIGIRESLLYSDDPLTDAEREHVEQHVVIGPLILAPLEHLGSVIDYVRGHHEHWDGTGYADGLKGEAIPLGARIIGAAEIYDALTSPRSYHPAMPADHAVEQMRSLAGSILDPRVTVALEQAVTKRKVLVFLDE